ncbi:transducin family protein / WD-40 repeat family protein [Wolffia australiana]
MGIFEPYRALGYITAGVPFSAQRRGTETFVTVSVGKSWQIYNCAKLNLVLVGPQFPKKIRSLASAGDHTFAACGTDITVCVRAHQVATWSAHKDKVNLLFLFGDLILSTDIKGNLFIWNFKDTEKTLRPISHIVLEDQLSPTCIMHPDTYLNKIIIGSREGSFHLWNISTQKKLFDFKGWNSSIRCCVSSPALDVVAVGCSDGTVHVHNIRYDEEIVSFSHATHGAVTALSFRTDGIPLLASGESSGVIAIWNLEKKRLHSIIKDAHDGSILSLHFFANEPVLMSSADDNSIKMWIFDTSDGEARLLRFRSGHSSPPLCIRFYGNGRRVLSAGQDRAFRLFSVVQDQQSRELSQHHVTKRAKQLKVKEEEIKLKPVIGFDFAEIRERDWCNVVTCHMDTPRAYVWRVQNFALGEHILTPSAHTQTPVKACAISACGNFAFLGTEGGWIERFNLQSGISRSVYLDPSESRSTAHDSEVIGLACDATNSALISVGYHGDLKMWSLKKCDLKYRLDVGHSVVRIVYHRGNGLLATAAVDMVLRVFDVVNLRMVRKFEGHTDRITDLCFSEDGKWLLSSSMDGTLRVWDVILGRQIDAISVDISITTFSLSPSMDIMVTSHVDQNGIYVWVNQAIFSGSSTIGTYSRVKEVKLLNFPAADQSEDQESEQPRAGHVSHEETFDLSNLQVQIPNLVTLSLLPRSQWQSLTKLDIIKARNKPIEPPKKPEKAPFFLPSVPSLSGEIIFKNDGVAAADEEITQVADAHISSKLDFNLPSVFLKQLQSCAESGNHSAFTDYLRGLGPSDIDLELRMLQIIDDEEIQRPEERPELRAIELLLDYFTNEISRKNNFEFVQAIMRLFLKIHGETVRRHSALQSKAKQLLEVQTAVWQRMDSMFQNTRCLVTFLSNLQF